MIYLDNAATTRVSEPVINAMLPYFTENYGNPGSVHSMGREAKAAVEKARAQAAEPIGAKPENIVFTSGGSEANALAILGLTDYLRDAGKTHIITTPVEHHSVLETIKSLFYKGFEVTYLPVDRIGRLDPGQLEQVIKPDTGLVSVMGINNETGNVYPLHDIGALCRERGVLFHTDCVQAYGNMKIDVEKDGIAFLSVSGHKFHAPKGTGFLYAGRKELLKPIVPGGGQESGLRSGTENVPGIVGLGAAAYELSSSMAERSDVYRALRDTFIGALSSKISDLRINGNPEPDSKIISLAFGGVDGETLLMLLSSMGVIVSAGSACSAHSAVPSHVLKAMRMSDARAKSSIRVSFSEYTTKDEVCEAAGKIARAAAELKGEV